MRRSPRNHSSSADTSSFLSSSCKRKRFSCPTPKAPNDIHITPTSIADDDGPKLYSFSFGGDMDLQPDTLSAFNALVCNDGTSGHFHEWVNITNASAEKMTKDGRSLVVGMDCEWCPVWFRNGGPERVCTVQLFNPLSGALVISLVICLFSIQMNTNNYSLSLTHNNLLASVKQVNLTRLPEEIEVLLGNEQILKVGVNIVGDATRLARDFHCSIRGLVDVSKGSSRSM